MSRWISCEMPENDCLSATLGLHCRRRGHIYFDVGIYQTIGGRFYAAYTDIRPFHLSTWLTELEQVERGVWRPGRRVD